MIACAPGEETGSCFAGCLCSPANACPAGCYVSEIEQADGSPSEPFCSNGIVTCASAANAWSVGAPADNCGSGTLTYLDGGREGSFCCANEADPATDGGGYASLCPDFQSQPECPAAPGAVDCARPDVGCGLDSLPTGLPCTAPAQCAAIIYPCPDWQKYIGAERTDGYICSCTGGRWSCDDCDLGEALCQDAG